MTGAAISPARQVRALKHRAVKGAAWSHTRTQALCRAPRQAASLSASSNLCSPRSQICEWDSQTRTEGLIPAQLFPNSTLRRGKNPLLARSSRGVYKWMRLCCTVMRICISSCEPGTVLSVGVNCLTVKHPVRRKSWSAHPGNQIPPLPISEKTGVIV